MELPQNIDTKFKIAVDSKPRILQNVALDTKGSHFTVKYESEKMNSSSNTNKDNVDQPSLSQYFGQSPSTSQASSFFDQISSSGNGPAMMTSVRESASSQDLFQAASIPSFPTVINTHTGAATVMSTPLNMMSQAPSASEDTCLDPSSRTEVKSMEDLTPTDSDVKTPFKEEPIVCRIFASQEVLSDNSNNISSGKVFFDMLGSGATSQATSPGAPLMLGIDLTTPSGASSMVTSPDFTTTTDGSFLSPSSPATPTPTGDPMESVLGDESFPKSSNTHPSDTDRRRDAWIPSDRTRQCLIAVATSPSGTYFPERELLTMPGVVMEEDMIDTVNEIVSHYLGEGEASERKVLTSNDVTQDERGLRELIQAGCFRAAINLTGRLLTIYGQGAGRSGHPSKHTVHSIQLWFTRLSLHVKLRSFSLAEVESEPFGDLDRPDLYFQFYPELYGGRLGSMVPFAFRLLVAELPQYLMKYQEALNNLHTLLATVRRVFRNLNSGLCEDGSPAQLSPSDRSESKKLWISREARVLHSIVNCALYQKDYSLAVEVLELLLRSHDYGSHHKRALQSALGRVFLQLGDVIGAEKNFALARDLRQQQSASSGTILTGSSDLRDLVDRGLMAVAQNAFQEAYECFHKASALDPANVMLLNNMGVCLLYLGRLKEALSFLEGAVHNNPTRGLHESLLLNVCTLYELESSFCNQKKLGMLRLVSKYKGDGVYVGCLKL